MKQSVTFITLGVDDLEVMKRFYTEKFGWVPLKEEEGLVFFKLNGIILSLFPNPELAEDAGVFLSDERDFRRMTFSLCLPSIKEVDETFEGLSEKDVPILKRPKKVFWGGYAGYVEDVEHNLWEIAFNPFLEMDEEGRVITHT